MAGCADDERLAPHFRHQGRPWGWLLPRRGEVGQLADLVGLHLGPLAAPFAFTAQEPGDQLPAADGRGGQAVIDDRLALPFERDTAEPCDQWLPARPLLAGLVTGTRPVLGGDVALYLRAIFVTVERCLQARVFSIDTWAVRCSRSSS